MCTFESDLYEARRLLHEDTFFSALETEFPQLKDDLKVYRELTSQAIKDKASYAEGSSTGFILAVGMEDVYRFFIADIDWEEYSYLATIHDMVIERFKSAIKRRDYKLLSDAVTYMNSMAVLAELEEFDTACLSTENLIAFLVADTLKSVSSIVA